MNDDEVTAFVCSHCGERFVSRVDMLAHNCDPTPLPPINNDDGGDDQGNPGAI